jgi:antitoxin (DNA-binding transcriptional repressor) of toxin-antitoxin stability system
MKNLKVAEARARFGEILDEAEQGGEVVIERRGVCFRLVAEGNPAARAAKAPLFDFVAPAVMTGQWTWKPGKTGVVFAARRKQR